MTNVALALETLGKTAENRAQDKTRARLRDAEEVVGAPFLRVTTELEQWAREGAAPGTSAASHLLSAGGKRVRPLATLLACACFGEVTRNAEKFATAAELVHAATLLHDDVIDDGSERRGMPAARRLWGNAVSVLGGDLLLVHALSSVEKTGDRVALTELFATLRELVDGEIVQLRLRTEVDLSEATYDQIVAGKTASLFVWALRAGARAGGASDAEIARFGEFGAHLGAAFQLVDDVIDYAGDAASAGKKLGADLLEGKLSLPLILASKEDACINQLITELRAGDASRATEIGERVRATHAISESRARAEAATKRAINAIASASDTAAKALLCGVARELAARAS